MAEKSIKHAYLCDGRPKCYGCLNCGLAFDDIGHCTHTTDISYALHRKELIHDRDYYLKHMKMVANSDFEEISMEV